MSKIKTELYASSLGLYFGSDRISLRGAHLELAAEPSGPYTVNLMFKSDFTLGLVFHRDIRLLRPYLPVLTVVQGAPYKAWCVEFSDDIVFRWANYIHSYRRTVYVRNTLTLTPGNASIKCR